MTMSPGNEPCVIFYQTYFVSEQRAQFTEVPEKIVSDGMNILGLVVFSVALGIVIGVIGEDGKPMKNFFKSLEACSMKLIGWVIM